MKINCSHSLYGINPLYNNISFGAMKKSQFSGIELFCVNKYQAPIEKFKSHEDFNEWTEPKLDELLNNFLKSNNVIIEINPITNNFNVIRGVDVACMYAVKDLKIEKMIMCLNGDKGGKLWELCSASDSEIDFNRLWQSGKISFGNFDKAKILKEVNLLTLTDLNLKITTDKGEKTFKVYGKNKVQRVRVNLKSKIFEISFTGDNSNFLLKTTQFVFAL